MPELPEVETVRRGLEHHVVGRTIETVRVLHPRAVRRQQAGPAEFESALAGRSLDSARRRGKYLWMSVGEDALLAHLGMSGQLLVVEPDRPLSPHVRIWFTIQGRGARPALHRPADVRSHVRGAGRRRTARADRAHRA